MLRWCRIVANQPTRCTTSSGLHAVVIPRAPGGSPPLRPAPLPGPGAAQQGFHLPRPRRLARYEDAKLVVREAGVVGDRPEAARREEGVEQDAQDGRERAEQDRHLEHDHDVRRDRADGFAAQDDRPVVRHIQGDPGPDGTTGDAADQGEHADRAHGLVERVLDFVPWNRRIHREVGVAALAQLADRIDGRVQVPEHAQDARGRGRVEDRGERVRELHACTALPRLGAGSTSFTSEIDTAGKFFTNKRNHMKNQPKLPAMMPQSAHVGLYVALANRSNGSPASDTTMITKRSNHIPMFTMMDTTNSAMTLVRTFLDHKSHGNNPLQMFIVQLAHQNGPNARYQKAARSCELPPNQAVKFSVQ